MPTLDDVKDNIALGVLMSIEGLAYLMLAFLIIMPVALIIVFAMSFFGTDNTNPIKGTVYLNNDITKQCDGRNLIYSGGHGISVAKDSPECIPFGQ